MTDTDRALEAIERAANGLLPELSERLGRHGLGEIEVVDGDLRLRVRGRSARPPGPSAPEASSTGGATPDAGSRTPQGGADVASSIGVSSPAVGFFVYADGLGPGQPVGKGDPLGHVEMLGVRHDVRAPRGGTVRHLVAESGEAVEYGQVVVELAAEEASR